MQLRLRNLLFGPALAHLVAVGFLLVLAGCVPFAIPIPWAPSDPFADIKKEFEKGELSLADILLYMGEPWAAIGDRTFVYVNSKPSSIVLYGVAGYGGESAADAAPMTTKDFVLIIDFDDQGVARNYETYADSLLHEHCFENGVCLARGTLNALLLPPHFDQSSKLFESKQNECSVYFFRDKPESDVGSENDYVGILVRRRGADWPLKSAVSVESGYSHWILPAQTEYVIETDFLSPRYYPFDTKTRTSNRQNLRKNFKCESGELLFVRFALPSSKRIPTVLEFVSENVGREKVSELRRLMDLY